MEEWKQSNINPLLWCSSLGRIRSDEYHAGTRTYKLNPTLVVWDGKRYILVFRRKTYRVGRLICDAWYGPPEVDLVAMHLDEDSRNNVPTNLRWGTQKENLNFPGFLEYCHGRTGENSPVINGRK